MGSDLRRCLTVRRQRVFSEACLTGTATNLASRPLHLEFACQTSDSTPVTNERRPSPDGCTGRAGKEGTNAARNSGTTRPQPRSRPTINDTILHNLAGKNRFDIPMPIIRQDPMHTSPGTHLRDHPQLLIENNTNSPCRPKQRTRLPHPHSPIHPSTGCFQTAEHPVGDYRRPMSKEPVEGFDVDHRERLFQLSGRHRNLEHLNGPVGLRHRDSAELSVVALSCRQCPVGSRAGFNKVLPKCRPDRFVCVGEVPLEQVIDHVRLLLLKNVDPVPAFSPGPPATEPGDVVGVTTGFLHEAHNLFARVGVASPHNVLGSHVANQPHGSHRPMRPVPGGSVDTVDGVAANSGTDRFIDAVPQVRNVGFVDLIDHLEGDIIEGLLKGSGVVADRSGWNRFFDLEGFFEEPGVAGCNGG